MNGLWKVLPVAVVAALFVSGCGEKQVETKRTDAEPVAAKVAAGVPQTTCPVMDGSPINKSLFVDHNGKRIYFCCGGCDATFKKDPEKYLKKLAAQGVVLEDSPAASAPAAKSEHPAGSHKPSGNGNR